jgi:hypothetical protein
MKRKMFVAWFVASLGALGAAACTGTLDVRPTGPGGADGGVGGTGTSGVGGAGGMGDAGGMGGAGGATACEGGTMVWADGADAPTSDCGAPECSDGSKDCDDADADCGDSSTPPKAQGVPCTASNQCASAFCESGVCCDTACAGLCQACSNAAKGAGADGTCGFVVAGDDSQGQCVDQGGASCGTDGKCDGDGACQMYASGTVCVPGSCYMGKVTFASTCDGAGTCTAGGFMACLPYSCTDEACLTTCADDGDCAGSPQDPPYCDASGHCDARQLPGQPCTGADQCYTNNCDDGVCCAGACNGTCNTCAAAGMVGECGVEPAGANNPNHPCPNGGVCDGVDGTSASCVQCVTDSNCAAPTPVCDVPTGACMCCLFLSGEPCTTGTQCASGVCTSPGNTCM